MSKSRRLRERLGRPLGPLWTLLGGSLGVGVVCIVLAVIFRPEKLSLVRVLFCGCVGFVVGLLLFGIVSAGTVSSRFIKDTTRSWRRAIVDLSTGELATTPLDQRVFFPYAIDTARQRIVFSGSQHAYLVDFGGQVVATLAYGPGSIRGASFNRVTGEIALGGNGIHVWNVERGDRRQLRDTGLHPAWSPDGKQIWFSESDSNLWRLDVERMKAERIIQLEADIGKNMNYGQPVVSTSDGRYLLARLTKKVPVSEQEEASRRRLWHKGMPEDAYCFDHLHAFCLADVEAHQVWQHPGYAHQVAWVEG